MYLGTADAMLQVARYKNTEDISRAAAHHISKTVADLRAHDPSLSRHAHHVPAFGRLTELLLPKRAASPWSPPDQSAAGRLSGVR